MADACVAELVPEGEVSETVSGRGLKEFYLATAYAQGAEKNCVTPDQKCAFEFLL